MIQVCFVCLGNICRSPTAEGVMLALVEEAGLEAEIGVESAGTGAYHVGERADERSRACAKRRGVTLHSRARRFEARDFGRFHYVLALDGENKKELESRARNEEDLGKIALLRVHEGEDRDEDHVPDPYYGGPNGFDDVYEICERACQGLLEHLRSRHDLD